MNHQPLRICFVYDRVNKFGGAERVLLALHQIWPDAPLFTGVYHPDKAAWAKTFKVFPSFLNRVSFWRDKHEYLAPLMPYAFESFDFKGFDVIISVTSAEAKGIITKPGQLHLCYLLTPTKYLYQRELYRLSSLKRKLYTPLLNNLQKWDQVAASRPDYYVAISQVVADRCEKYYHLKPHAVIYPPVNCDLISSHETLRAEPPPGRAHRGGASGQGHSFYLLVSRLVPIKNTRLALEAFRQLPSEKLVIAGIGSELPALRKISPPNVEFKGVVTDTQLKDLYREAHALIFPQEEDFGIAAVEAQAAGLPVIAFNKGGALETVIDGETGVFFKENNADSLAKAILKSQEVTWYHQTIRKHALRFDQRHFQLIFKQTVEDLWQQNQP